MGKKATVGETRKGDAQLALVTFLFGLLIGAAVFFNLGMNYGARQHADGEVVVVSLPDGSRTVVRAKP